MKTKFLAVNHSALFAAVSIYFGTGWSTAIFQFPVMPQLTIDNYYLHFIPQIDAATDFFTFLVTLMFVTCVVMIISEWRTRFRWVPILLLLAVIAATCLTYFVIFPVNDVLRAGIKDLAQLQEVVHQWIFLTKIRVAIWSFEWALMMYYFACMAFCKEQGR